MLYFDCWSHFENHPSIFSILCSRNYHYNKRPVIVDNIMIPTIHVGLFLIVVLYSISLWWVINILFISIGLIVWKNEHNVPLYIELRLYSYFCHVSDQNRIDHFLPQILNLWFLGIFCHNFARQSKNSINCFLILINKTNLHLIFVGNDVRKNTRQCL